MDLATLIGMIVAFLFVLMGIGSNLKFFIDIPSAMIVVGGTIGTIFIYYPLKEVLSVTKVVKNAFFAKEQSPDKIIATLVEFAQKARREGILALESSLESITDPFLKKGIQLAVDGLEPEAIENILSTEIEYMESRHKRGANIFSTLGSVAPAMGMIGTLIGLVIMLQNMQDASSIGPAMAVALITTFYGAILANIIFLPIAGKLKNRSEDEILQKWLIVHGIKSIQLGDNPRIVEQKLHSFIPPNKRVSVFE